MKRFAFAAFAAALLATGPALASSITIEDYETGDWGASWQASGGGAPGGDVNASSAFTGSFGAADTDSLWNIYGGYTLQSGDRLQANVRATAGRFYLGFGADATGASSFVMAPNTGDIRFQNNESFGYTELNTLTYGFVSGSWYMAEVYFAPDGDVIGSLFDSSGSTLLAQLTASGLTRTGGGSIALRSFGGNAIDNVRVVSGTTAPIPLPAAGWLLLGRIALLGGVARRQGRAAA